MSQEENSNWMFPSLQRVLIVQFGDGSFSNFLGGRFDRDETCE